MVCLEKLVKHYLLGIYTPIVQLFPGSIYGHLPFLSILMGRRLPGVDWSCRLAGFTCPNGASYAANPEPLKFDCRLWRAARDHSEETFRSPQARL